MEKDRVRLRERHQRLVDAVAVEGGLARGGFFSWPMLIQTSVLTTSAPAAASRGLHKRTSPGPFIEFGNFDNFDNSTSGGR